MDPYDQFVLDNLIAAGLMDANGNWLIDLNTGLPLTPATTGGSNRNNLDPDDPNWRPQLPDETGGWVPNDPDRPTPPGAANVNPLDAFLVPTTGSTGKTYEQLMADQTAIYAQSQKAYDNLLAFQQKQNDTTQALAEQIRLSREFSIPRAPERPGRVAAGGSTTRVNAARTGVADLLIRY